MGFNDQWRDGADDAQTIADFFKTLPGIITAAVAALIGIGLFVYAAVSGL